MKRYDYGYAYICQYTRSFFIQIIACHLSGVSAII